MPLFATDVDPFAKEWDQATSIAKAFSIGKAESEAVSQLMTAIKPDVVKRLEECVRARGMARLMQHEVISKGIFSENFTSGSGQCESWKDQLRNKDDGELVFWLSFCS